MTDNDNETVRLPSSDDIRRAIEVYLQHAWEGNDPPEQVQAMLPPPGDFDVAEWLGGEMIERDPPEAGPASLKVADVRLGNLFYPNMKFRMARLPNDPGFVFSVDSHDAVLQAPAGSPDAAMLEELKAHNAKLSDAILKAWDEAGLPTERNYLRRKLQQARERKAAEDDSGAGDA
jgi:hypothetical protein